MHSSQHEDQGSNCDTQPRSTGRHLIPRQPKARNLNQEKPFHHRQLAAVAHEVDHAASSGGGRVNPAAGMNAVCLDTAGC